MLSAEQIEHPVQIFSFLYLVLLFMPIKKDDHQDDYYANIQKSDASADSAKKPLKLKLKVVAKKPQETEEVSSIPETPVSEVPEPKKPTARLVEREHESHGLLRSVMKSSAKNDEPKEEKKRPVISFSKIESKVKVLENRPVMQLPPEERRPPRRDSDRPSS